jgi:hypothetical protein
VIDCGFGRVLARCLFGGEEFVCRAEGLVESVEGEGTGEFGAEDVVGICGLR